MHTQKGPMIVSHYLNKIKIVILRNSLRVINLSLLSVPFLSFSLFEAQIKCVVYILEHVDNWSALRAVSRSCFCTAGNVMFFIRVTTRGKSVHVTLHV